MPILHVVFQGFGAKERTNRIEKKQRDLFIASDFSLIRICGTMLIRKRILLELSSRPMPRALRWS